MKVTGLIMECNPFHEGHAYILRQARMQTQADYIVVAMSGDYVQRGQPAVFDKYIRAEQVLDGGADLVLELPLFAACGSAEYFARGGISLLQGLGVVTDLCFGSESGDTEYILRMARILEEAERSAGRSYSAADPGRTGRETPDKAAQTAGFKAKTEKTTRTEESTAEMETARAEESKAEMETARAEESTAEMETARAEESKAEMETARAEESKAETEPAQSGNQYQKKLQAVLRSGLSFPAARAAAIPGFPSTPNDLLAVEYCRALLHSPGHGTDNCRALRTSAGDSKASCLSLQNSAEDGTASCLTLPHSASGGGNSIRPHAIPRIKVPSATEYRKALLQQRMTGAPGHLTGSLPENLSGHLPEDLSAHMAEPLSENLSGHLPEDLSAHWPETSVSQVPLYPLGPDDFSAALLYALRMQESDLNRYADVTPYIADRIRRLLPRFDSFSSFCDLLKSKNLTYSRVSRCLLHILLQMEQARLDSLQMNGMALYARPLAMNRSAAPLFSAIQKHASLPFLSKLAGADALLSPQALNFLQEEIRAEDLYTLILRQTYAAAGLSPDRSAVGSPAGVPRAPQRKIIVKEYDR